MGEELIIQMHCAACLRSIDIKCRDKLGKFIWVPDVLKELGWSPVNAGDMNSLWSCPSCVKRGTRRHAKEGECK